MQWSHPVLNQQTSRKRPYAFFFFVTQWYHATNASHGAVCQFSKYSDGLKLRMLGPSSSRTPKECRRGNKFKKKTGKMPVSSIFNYLLREFVFFFNRPQVNFLRFYRVIWNLVPHIKCLRPKRAARSMSKNWTPYFENTRYTRGYVLCAAHIECRQKTYKCHHFVSKPLVLLQKMPPKTYRNVIILRHVFSKHYFSTWFEGLYKLIISYE